MDVKHITDDFAVSGQISTEDLPVLAAMGFKSVICNRPDGEAADQASFELIAAAAKDAGIETRDIPVSPGAMSAQNVRDFRKALDEMPHPVLAYCRSGARSTTIYEAAQRSG